MTTPHSFETRFPRFPKPLFSFWQEVEVNVSHLTIPPSSAARANLHHFSSSPPLLVSPPTHTKKFPVSPPSFLIFHLDLLLFGVLPCFTPTILLTLPPSSPFDCYHCAPQLPLSSYLPIFQLGFHHCCQYNPPQTPSTLAKIRRDLHLFKPYVCYCVGFCWRGRTFRKIRWHILPAAASCKDYVDSGSAVQCWAKLEQWNIQTFSRELMTRKHFGSEDFGVFIQNLVIEHFKEEFIFIFRWKFVKWSDIYWYST